VSWTLASRLQAPVLFPESGKTISGWAHVQPGSVTHIDVNAP
jgi:hypothetical protein